MEVVFYTLLFILISQPFILIIRNIILNLAKTNDISEDSLIYTFCKWLQKERVIKYVAFICGLIIIPTFLVFISFSDIIAIYNEKDYDVEAMAIDLSLLANKNEDYKIVFLENRNKDGEKEIKVVFYRGPKFYQIQCYGIKSVNIDNGTLKNISEKYKLKE